MTDRQKYEEASQRVAALRYRKNQLDDAARDPNLPERHRRSAQFSLNQFVMSLELERAELEVVDIEERIVQADLAELHPQKEPASKLLAEAKAVRDAAVAEYEKAREHAGGIDSRISGLMQERMALRFRREQAEKVIAREESFAAAVA